jgi:hypothetical protein
VNLEALLQNELITPTPPEVANRHLETMFLELEWQSAPAVSKDQRSRRRAKSRTLSFVAVVSMSLTGGLAAAGALPNAAQQLVSAATSVVGIDLPDGSTPAPHPSVVVPAEGAKVPPPESPLPAGPRASRVVPPSGIAPAANAARPAPRGAPSGTVAKSPTAAEPVKAKGPSGPVVGKPSPGPSPTPSPVDKVKDKPTNVRSRKPVVPSGDSHPTDEHPTHPANPRARPNAEKSG